MRRTRSNSGGFTLIELVIIVVAIGFLAAMVAPRYGNAVNRYRVDAAARRIAADLALTQATARSTSSSRTIAFDLPNNAYRMIGQIDPSRSNTTYSVELNQEPYYVSISSVSFGVAPSISFNGYGMPSNAGSIQIRAANYTRTITLEADNGTVTIQ